MGNSFMLFLAFIKWMTWQILKALDDDVSMIKPS